MDGPELAGRVSFVPADRERWGWYEGAWMEFAAILLDPQWIARALERDGIAVPMQWRSVDNVRDPFILGAVRALVDEMETGGVAGPLLAQSVALSLALHVVRRIERARVLRETTDDPIAQIAAAVGLSSQSHLTTLFRKHLGTTPEKFRRSRRSLPGANS